MGSKEDAVPPTMKSMDAKIVVLGGEGVGKTSLVVRYVNGVFLSNTTTTIGASFFTHKLFVFNVITRYVNAFLVNSEFDLYNINGLFCRNVDNVRVKLTLWDTAGQER